MTQPPDGALPGVPPAGRGPFAAEYRVATLGLVALVALGAFESLAVSTAMPSVVADLGGIALYATAFAGPVATSVIGLTLAGFWSDRRGPVMPLLVGVTLFVVGLVVAGLAPSMLALVAGRIVQGVGTGLYSVVLYVIVARVYPERLQPRVFAAFAAAWVVPGIVGPYLAGLVVEHAGWRWVFLGVPALAVPAVLALWPALVGLRGHAVVGNPEAAPARAGRRGVGFAVLTAAGVLALHRGGQSHGAVELGWLTTGVVATAFALPRLLPVGTLRSARGLPSVVVLRGLLSAAFFGAEVFLPLLLQTHHGLSPAGAGAVLTFGALTWSTGSWARGRSLVGWSDAAWVRFGASAIGVGVVLAGLLALDGTPVLVGFIGWAVAGLGMGAAFPTLSVLLLRLSAPHEQGVNSAALQLMDAVGVAIALALVGSLFNALGGPVTSRSFVAGFAVSIALAALAAVIAPRTTPAHPHLTTTRPTAAEAPPAG
ncbi:MAG TPA: MFS transporter [Cellulomonas sp.]|uniref:MFS transporter n=1 Tax=Cellulomonas sp. TaxID=40001 RepID=UPI002E2F76D2|nr:MFS transporter [Cellulomonas sp.]HEX5333458.1 MFS transporter [Cellulomonas sp.]